MHFHGMCNQCRQIRWLRFGVCPECGRRLKALRDQAAEEMRQQAEKNRQERILEQFVGQLDQPDEVLWQELGFRGD